MDVEGSARAKRTAVVVHTAVLERDGGATLSPTTSSPFASSTSR